MTNNLFRFRYFTDQNETGIVEFKSKQDYKHLIWGRACVKATLASKGEVIMLENIVWGA